MPTQHILAEIDEDLWKSAKLFCIVVVPLILFLFRARLAKWRIKRTRMIKPQSSKLTLMEKIKQQIFKRLPIGFAITNEQGRTILRCRKCGKKVTQTLDEEGNTNFNCTGCGTSLKKK